jgi:hypothetical protein
MVAQIDIVPVTFSVGLALTQPEMFDQGIEVAGVGYKRMLVKFIRPSDAPDSETIACSAVTFEWPRAGSYWGEIGWVMLFDLDGVYVGFGNVVASPEELMPTTVVIDRGDVARVKAADIVLRNGPLIPRPWSVGRYGRGPYSRYPLMLDCTATLTGGFLPASAPCCASGWIMEALPST